MTTLSRAATVRGFRVVSAERWDADEAVTQLYAVHYAPLVRLAALLVRHSGEAEEIVQDAFVAMHSKWRSLHEPEHAVGYLRRSIVNRARSAHRHHSVADKHLPRQVVAEASAEDHALTTESRALMMAALDTLPPRQREVLVLRYYSDLSEADIADTLGISRGAVKSHASRGLHSLRTRLEDQQ
ncbi:MAG: SigE family RNA polymerase sigma factor [Propionibacteriales bacterium]|nr:SigE family RNA polymerase sigma factor [Propionibacteriales bacterium]